MSLVRPIDGSKLSPPGGSRRPNHHCPLCQRVFTAEALVAAARRKPKKLAREKPTKKSPPPCKCDVCKVSGIWGNLWKVVGDKLPADHKPSGMEMRWLLDGRYHQCRSQAREVLAGRATKAQVAILAETVLDAINPSEDDPDYEKWCRRRKSGKK